jgi:surface polysaccharide O-acyltransferase-like enzyme
MMKTLRVIYSVIMLLLAFLLFIIMESSTYQMNPDLRIIAEAVYYVGIVVAIGMAGLPWIFDKANTKSE